MSCESGARPVVGMVDVTPHEQPWRIHKSRHVHSRWSERLDVTMMPGCRDTGAGVRRHTRQIRQRLRLNPRWMWEAGAAIAAVAWRTSRTARAPGVGYMRPLRLGAGDRPTLMYLHPRDRASKASVSIGRPTAMIEQPRFAGSGTAAQRVDQRSTGQPACTTSEVEVACEM